MMITEGDKVICINKGKTNLELYKVYTIISISEIDNEIDDYNTKKSRTYIKVQGKKQYHKIDRFITLSQFRKMKLNKIINESKNINNL